MHRRIPRSAEFRQPVTYIDDWLVRHPGRVATRLMSLEEGDGAEIYHLADIRANQENLRFTFTHPRLQGIVDRFGLDTSGLDPWRRPETD